MMGKDCSPNWCAGVLACTSTGEDARTPIFKYPNLPVFQHSFIPFQATLSFIPGTPVSGRTYNKASQTACFETAESNFSRIAPSSKRWQSFAKNWI